MSRSLRVAIPLTLLVAAFLIFAACSGDPTTNNQSSNNTNSSETASDSDTNTAVALGGPKCDQNQNSATRARKMNEHLRDKGLGDRDLERQRGYAFTIEFVPDGNEVIMKVKGKLAGGSDSATGDPDPKMKHLLDKLDKYMKRGCADRSTYEGQAAGSSFEYVACPYPYQPCEDGTCGCRKDDAGNIVRIGPGNTNPGANSGSNNSSGTSDAPSPTNANRSNSSGSTSSPSNN